MRYILVGLWLVAAWSVSEPSPQESIAIAVNMSRTLSVPGLVRAAVGNSKLLKARAVNRDKLLLIGKQAGKTMVQAWTEAGRELSFSVTILPAHLYVSDARAEEEVVRVSLELLEVDSSDSENSGVRWPDVIEVSASATVQGSAGGTTGLNYVGTVTTAKGWIEQLVSRGWARFLARPSLYVRLGEQVTFHSGGEFPVATVSEKYGLYHRTMEWKSFGLTVKIKPESGDMLHLSSDVEIEVSEREPIANAESVPALNKRSLVTKMNSTHGEPVILSGLVRNFSSRQWEGMPWLSSIPILGWLLFSRKREFAQQSEVMMLMTLSFKTRLQHEQELNSMWERLKNAAPR